MLYKYHLILIFPLSVTSFPCFYLSSISSLSCLTLSLWTTPQLPTRILALKLIRRQKWSCKVHHQVTALVLKSLTLSVLSLRLGYVWSSSAQIVPLCLLILVRGTDILPGPDTQNESCLISPSSSPTSRQATTTNPGDSVFTKTYNSSSSFNTGKITSSKGVSKL